MSALAGAVTLTLGKPQRVVLARATESVVAQAESDSGPELAPAQFAADSSDDATEWEMPVELLGAIASDSAAVASEAVVVASEAAVVASGWFALRVCLCASRAGSRDGAP